MPASKPPPPRPALGRYLVRMGIGVVLLAFVGWQLHSQWQELRKHELVIAWPWVALSGVLFVAYLVFAAALWKRLMRALGQSLPLATAFRVYFLSNLAKYLPGAVWNLVGRVALSPSHGIDAAKTGTSVVLELVLQVLSMLIVGPLALAPVLRDKSAAFMAAPAAALVAALIVSHPGVLNRLLAVAEKIVRRSLPRFELGYGFMLQMLAGNVLAWALFGVTMACLGRALLPSIDAPGFLLLGGGTIVAWLMGMAAFFLPGGLGARELSLTALLQPSHVGGWPALFALVSRVWILLFELGAFLVASRISRPRALQ